jgi:glycosyltransferase involved in cell wall biosynthesis
MLRIGFVTAEPFWTRQNGYFGLTKQLIELLSEIGNCRVIVLNGGDRSGDFPSALSPQLLRPGSQPNKRLRQIRSLVTTKASYECEIGYPKLRSTLDSVLSEIGADVVVLNHLRSAFVVRDSALKNVRTIYWSHNCESASAASIAEYPLDPLSKWYYRGEARKFANLERQVLQHVDACVALTPEDRARFAAIEPPCKLFTIPPAYSMDRGAERVHTAASKEVHLIGSFHWAPKRSNAAWLATEVFAKVRSQVPDASLHIVGTGASKLAYLTDRCPGVFVHSDVPKLQPFYDRAAVAVVPEMQCSGFKLKVLEAAARSMAIVSTSAGVEGTGLQDGSSCLVANNADSFAASIVRLLRDRELACRIGDCARDEVALRFSLENVRMQTRELIHSVLNQGAPAHS